MSSRITGFASMREPHTRYTYMLVKTECLLGKMISSLRLYVYDTAQWLASTCTVHIVKPLKSGAKFVRTLLECEGYVRVAILSTFVTIVTTDRLYWIFIRSYSTFSLSSDRLLFFFFFFCLFQPLYPTRSCWSLSVVVVGVVRGARIIAAKRSVRFYSRQATRIVNVFGHYSRFC